MDETEELRRRALAAKQAPIEDGLFARVLIAEAEAPTHQVPVRAHMRTVPGEAPPSGDARRDAFLEEIAKLPAVKRARAYLHRELAKLYREKEYAFRVGAQTMVPYVTADDVDAILARWPERPRELDERPTQAWRGSVFGKEWCEVPVVHRSKREHMQGTRLSCWALREQVAA